MRKKRRCHMDSIIISLLQSLDLTLDEIYDLTPQQVAFFAEIAESRRVRDA
jgi:DNA polymerase III psi subunit